MVWELKLTISRFVCRMENVLHAVSSSTLRRQRSLSVLLRFLLFMRFFFLPSVLDSFVHFNVVYVHAVRVIKFFIAQFPWRMHTDRFYLFKQFQQIRSILRCCWFFFLDIKFVFSIRSHSTSSEEIAEPDPFRFVSNFAHVFIKPKWEILKIFGPLDPLLPPWGLF